MPRHLMHLHYHAQLAELHGFNGWASFLRGLIEQHRARMGFPSTPRQP